MASRKEQRERARQERIAAEREAAAKAARTRRLQIGGGVAAVVVVGAIIAIVVATSGGGGGASSVPSKDLGPPSAARRLKPAGDPGKLGPEKIPVPNGKPLAPAGSPGLNQSVHGITCQTGEQTLFHVHSHLTVFVDGKPRQIPYGIGIAPPRQVDQTPRGPFVVSGTCFSWLHTHAPDGIIHIESPVKRSYTLGDFFAVWGQPLGPDRVGPVHGPVTAFYNGQRFKGDPNDIPIGDDVQIQLDVGKPLIAPESIKFKGL